jgi:hypothetical protein
MNSAFTSTGPTPEPVPESPTSAFTETQAEMEATGTKRPPTPDAPAKTPVAGSKTLDPAPTVVPVQIVTTVLKNNNYAVQPGDLVIPLASDATNGNKVNCSGQEILLAFNSDTSAHTFTITSVPDRLGRSGDLTSYSVAGGAIAALALSTVEGWKQSDNTIHIQSDNALLKFAVLVKG